jgi:hypothetical protein
MYFVLEMPNYMRSLPTEDPLRQLILSTLNQYFITSYTAEQLRPKNEQPAIDELNDYKRYVEYYKAMGV